jgi:hypothetical protein
METELILGRFYGVYNPETLESTFVFENLGQVENVDNYGVLVEILEPDFRVLQTAVSPTFNFETGKFEDNHDYEAEIYETKFIEIHVNADALVSDLNKKYSEIERSTFTKQRSEAEAWQANNLALTPCLDHLALTRGIDRLMFIQKVIEAIADADQKSFAVVAVQQAKEDELNAAKAIGLDALNLVDTTLILEA